ncbi:uncharacterized protein [Typha angustifolia]|uniref:uncharacterized protein isoform X1 n=2 Tax=Typha angustifolia TaxID=59011 RepID=UPI003C2E9ED9
MTTTRSGRIQKYVEGSSSRSRSSGSKVKETKSSTTSGSTCNEVSRSRTPKRNAKDHGTTSVSTRNEDSKFRNPKIKAKDPSGHDSADPFILRRSNRETVAKKMSTPSPSSRKSGRLANQSTSFSPDKKKSLKTEVKRPQSPLRKSERIEKNSASSSSGLKDPSKNSSSPIKARKTREVKNEKKLAVTNSNKKSKKGMLNTEIVLSKKRKRLDARSYRALFKPHSKKTKTSGHDRRHANDNDLEGDMVDAGANDNTEVQDDGDKCYGLEEHEEHIPSKEVDLPVCKSVEGSGSGSDGVAELTLEADADSKLIRFSMRHTVNETSSFKYDESGPHSKCSGGSSQSPPVGVTAETNGGSIPQIESVVAVDRISTHESDEVELGIPTSVDSGSRARCSAVGFCPERGDISETTGNVKSTDINSDVAAAPSKIECDSLFRSVSEENPHNHDPAAKCCDKVKLSREILVGYTNQNCSLASPSMTTLTVPDEERWAKVSDRMEILEEHSLLPKLEVSSVDKADGSPNACLACKNPGMLVCCDGKGCKRNYHLSCLDPPLQTIPLGIWLCTFCVKRKIQFGVYSVTEGVESLWDVKEGMGGKHYLVKYMGLAHFYNRWIPEIEIQKEVPELVCKFNRKHQKEKRTRWKQEWTVPHRLLKKRLLMPQKLAEEFFHGLGDDFSYCNLEWLVKWRGLGYEDATWELETSSFLCTDEAMLLIKDYETRHEQARKASDPSKSNKALQVKQNQFQKLLRLPDGCPPGLDNDHLSSINQIREFWYKSLNAIFIDDQERVVKAILFILSLLSNACRPFLIVSTAASLSIWENKFNCLAPSVNLVVYNGDRDVRKMIQTLEFYEEGGCVMFQVLLSHPDAIIEDFETLEIVGWEAIIVDECQSSRVSKNLEQFKKLSTDFKLLLLSAPLKDNLAEYINLLSFLDPGQKETYIDSSKLNSCDSGGTLAILKERFSRYVAYERKPDSSKFVEYWVPVCLSDVQLELYCATLISNTLALRSYSKVDPVGALRDILVSLWKCCDHPYLVDQSLQSTLSKDRPIAEILDVGVNASGKLLMLDKILQEIQNHGLRVVILFQSVGGVGRNHIGDFLDDFLRQKFGADSYERIERGLVMSKKQAAMNMFNDKTRGRFVFLIESRACLPSIKLSFVDAVIIYDSDWNPLNDLRALQRISIESQFEQVMVFRLYSSCTVEEKVLIFAKEDMVLDSNIQNIIPSVSHSLLSWGASYHFGKLDRLHKQDDLNKCSEASTDKLLLDKVVLELLTKLSSKADKPCNGTNCSNLIKAPLSGTSYSRNIILVGEKEGVPSLDKDPPTFWSELLDGRCPQWRYIPEPSPRSRRRVQNFDELVVKEKATKLPTEENDEVKRKRRKLVIETISPTSLQGWLQDKRKEAAEARDVMLSENPLPLSSSRQSENQLALGSSGISLISPRKEVPIGISIELVSEVSKEQGSVVSEYPANSAGAVSSEIHNQSVFPVSADIDVHGSHTFELERREKLRNAQRSLHLLLKPELSKLCEILRLPGDVKGMAELFLEYIMNNHQVSQEPETILQAFKISLCWRAASFLKHKMNRKESLALAEKYLNYECNEELVSSVYDKLRILRKKFSHQIGALRNQDQSSSLEQQQSMSGKEPVCQTASNQAAFDHDELEDGKLRESPGDHRCAEQFIQREDEQVSVLEIPAEIHQDLGSLKDELLKKRIDLREKEILFKQQQEISDFERYKEERETSLKSEHHLDLERTNDNHADPTVRNDKIRLLNQEFSKKVSAFEDHMKCQRKKLEVLQLSVRHKEQQRKDGWLEKAKTGRLEESFDCGPLPDTGFIVEQFKWVSGQTEASDVLENSTIEHQSSSEKLHELIIEGSADCTNSCNLENSAIILSSLAEGIPIQNITSASQTNTADRVESARQIGKIVDVGTAFASGETGDMPVETETLASHASIMKSVGTEPDAMSAKFPGVVQNTSADSSCGRSSMSSMQEQRDFPLVVHQSSSSGCANDVSTNKELSIIKHGVTVSVGGESVPFSCASQQIVVSLPPSCDILPQQVGSTINNMTTTDPLHLQQVVSEMPLADQILGNASKNCCIGIEVVPCNPIQGSTQKTVAPEQQSLPPPAILVGQSNHLASQSIMQSSTSLSNIPSERTCAQDISNTCVQSELVNHLPQLFPMAPLMLFQGFQPEPLKNELTRIRLHEDLITKMHEDKKVRLRLEYDQEMEKIRRKYNALFQDEDSSFLQQKKMLEDVYNKVRMNQSFAEEFRAKFIENRGGSATSSQAKRQGARQQQLPQASLSQLTQRPSSALHSQSMPILTPASRPLPPASLASTRPRVPAIASTSSVQVVPQVSSVFPANSIRSQFSSMLPNRANIQVGSESRAPAPHLHRFRSQTAMPAAVSFMHNTGVIANQQQLSANLDSVPSAVTQLSPSSHPSVIPFSGVLQPPGLSVLHLGRGTSLSSDSPLGSTQNGGDFTSMQQLSEVGPPLDAWLTSNMSLRGNQSCINAGRSEAATDIVCLSDDD